jgi:hypothetical protein
MTPKRPSLRSAAALALGLAALAPGSSQEAPSDSPSDEDAGLYLMLFGEAPPAISPDDMLLVAAIEAECPASLEKAYVTSFARPLQPGDRMSAAELDARLAAVADRMSLSDMFYGSSASYERLENAAGDDGLVAVRVVLRADEGFWWAFGFSPWDLSVGYRNLGGGGKRVQATGGLNAQSLAYRDPSISYGPFYLAASGAHELRLRGGGVDPCYLYEDFTIGAELGLSASDDASVGLALRCSAFRSPEDYFLYPDYAAPSEAALSSLGLSADFEGLASAGLRFRLGSLSFKKRGGLRGQASLELDALGSSAAGWEAVPRISALASLRYDAPRLVRITLSERATYIGSTAAGGVPEALWAAAREVRCPGGLASGELASVSRLSLGLDRIAAVGFGFADMGIVPELFYEFAAVSRRAYDAAPRFKQDIGFLVKAVVSMPVGTTFAFGLAYGLEGESNSRISFVFEVE